MPRGVAYLSIGAPTAAGDWQVRAAMGEGDLSSWIVAGSFVSRKDAIHTYNFGLSYSTQEYRGGEPLSLSSVTDGSRNVGELYAVDRWRLSPGVAIEYGGRYAHYDYLRNRSLMSPRAGFTLEPTKGTRLTAVIAQRMVAPGAEEFLSPGPVGPWLPPERTFAPLRGEELRVERARSLDVLFEHEFDGAYVARRPPILPVGGQSAGHDIRDAGAGGAEFDRALSGRDGRRRRRGGLGSSPRHAGLTARAGVDRLQRRARPLEYAARRIPAAARGCRRRSAPQDEDIHDLTARVHTTIPETSTRVFLLYKVNSAFTRPDLSLTSSGLDGRFDVQVNQALPFGVGGTEWEVLVGVRNLFHDPDDPASIYDELLVVRPPKRVIGGFLVRF